MSRRPHSSIFVRPETTDRSGILTTWPTLLYRRRDQPRRSPADSTMLSAHEAYRTPRRASSARRRPDGGASHPKGQPAAVQRPRGQHLRHAGGYESWTHDVARDRAAVPHAHRDVRGPAPCRDHREPTRTGRRRCARSRARAGTPPRPAPRNSDRAQGQHPHDDDADDGRCAGVRRDGAALRGDAHEEPARCRCGDCREDRNDGARELRRSRDAHELQRRSWLRLQSVRSAPRPADERRWAAGNADRRLELRNRDDGELLGGQRRHRDVGVHPQPVQPEHAGGHQADGRTHQPVRRDPDHSRSGHARPDGKVRDGRRNHVRRAGERGTRPERSGHEGVHTAAGPRLHEAVARRRPQGRARWHPAGQLLRPDHATGIRSSTRRA